MLSINTNLPSIIAQNSLKQSTLKLNTAIERMTTGYKINGAKDNAANYSIATNMGVKLSSYQVAEDNCAMGLDLITTASESLDLISDKLVRLRALAEQSANGTYGEQSLKAINAEANALVDEIERSYKNTEYNGIKLFGESGGAFINEVVQRDTSSMTTLASVDENTEISSGTYSISTAEELAKLATMTNNCKVTGGDFVLANNIDLSGYENWTPIGTLSGYSFYGNFDGNGFIISGLNCKDTSLAIETDVHGNGLFGCIGADSTVQNLTIDNANVEGFYNVGALVGVNFGSVFNCNVINSNIKGQSSEYIINESGPIGVGGLVGYNEGVVTCSYVNNSKIKAEGDYLCAGGLVGKDASSLFDCYATNCNIEAYYGAGGLVGYGAAGNIQWCYSNSNIKIVDENNFDPLRFAGLVGNPDNYYIDSSTFNIDATYNASLDWDFNLSGYGLLQEDYLKFLEDNYGGERTLTTVGKSNTIAFQVGIKANEHSSIALDTSFSCSAVSMLRQIGKNNNDYLSVVDKLTSQVSAKQTEFGAAQNRLESALDEISTQYENLVSSRSTLRDADIAEVSSEYIRQQILQQASATLLSTANQTPALALQLL